MYVSSGNKVDIAQTHPAHIEVNTADTYRSTNAFVLHNRKWQDYVYIQCEYKSTWQKIKHLLREENKVKENKIP